MNLPELIDKLHSDEACREHLDRIRWPEGVACPNCRSKSISRIRTRRVYDCNRCRRHFSVTAGTIFHDSHLPLRTWFLAIHRISESKKGVSANQLKRELGITYKTAWFMCHRIRQAMKQPREPGLRGIIEIDETYVKGEGVPPGEKLKAGRGSQRTTAVLGMKERGGKVQATTMKRLRARQVFPWILQQVKSGEVAATYTDANTLYSSLGKLLPHEAIDHSVAYVIGKIHTNSVESFWSLLKRGMVGSYHRVSAKHLQRYVDEYCWRSNRQDSNFSDLLMVTAQARGITYTRLTRKARADAGAPMD